MKIIPSLFISASALFFLSCTDSEKQDQAKSQIGAPAVFSNPAQPANSATAGAVNPAHGQPGHNCAIPVGAPLNTPAQNQTAPQVTPQPQVIPQTQGTGSVATKGLNPEHGQPGHNCAIPVGAPLQ